MRKSVLTLLMCILLTSGVYADSLRITANPSPRAYSGMITDTINNRMILFGGMNYGMPGGQFFNDIWSLDCNSETWALIEPSGPVPSPRIEPAVAYNGAANEMIIFGGRDGSIHYNDVWILDLTSGSESWSEIEPSGTPPSPRRCATAIIDSVNNRLILFGGDDYIWPNNEVWSLDLNTVTWSMLNPSGTPPSERWAHCAVYDPTEHRMIIFAGAHAYEPMSNDVWALDLTSGSETWQELFPGDSQPDIRAAHFCAFDNLRGEMIIGFGYDYPSWIFYNDIWALNLSSLTWRQIFPNGVSVEGRKASCAAYDPFIHKTVIFGGCQGGDLYYFGDTYILTIDTLAVHENHESRISNYPYLRISSNPSRLPFHINAYVPFPGNVVLNVFDVSGRLVRTLINDTRNSGNYIIQWDGKNNKGISVPTGTYFIDLEIDSESVVEKAIVIE